MIQPGHGTVLYNKGFLHFVAVFAPGEERVFFKMCNHNGNVIIDGNMDEGDEIMDGFKIFYKEVDADSLGLIPDTDYYVSYWHRGQTPGQSRIVFNAFTYMPFLSAEYIDYPYIGDWSTQDDINDAAKTISDKIETAYLGNKKMVMTYCEELPKTNPRNLFVGCEDYVTEYIKDTKDSDWSKPIFQKIIYYWYDENKKLIKVGERD